MKTLLRACVRVTWTAIDGEAQAWLFYAADQDAACDSPLAGIDRRTIKERHAVWRRPNERSSIRPARSRAPSTPTLDRT